MADILFVDDNLDTIALFVTTLTLEGYKVDSCENGEKAVEYLVRCMQRGTSLPRIIVTDVNMPNMDGFELCFIVKNTPAYWHIPVILYTAVFPKLTEKMAITVAPDDYIIKNVSPKTVTEIIAKYIK